MRGLIILTVISGAIMVFGGGLIINAVLNINLDDLAERAGKVTTTLERGFERGRK